MIYLDYAATSWPKPPSVIEAMADYLTNRGGSPGRSGHRLSIEAARVVYDAREVVADFLGAPDPLRVVFASNATEALNMAMHGVLRPGDRVVTTGIEHNAVMRPLRGFRERGVHVTVVPCAGDGSLDLEEMAKALRQGAKLVTINHASNVVGTILPVAEVSRMAHEAGALVLLDAAQTAGALPLDMASLGVDLLAFTGHKSLLGPPGTGGLILGEAIDGAAFEPLLRGGTGSRSESDLQPEDLPDRLESGTPNGVGIAGLRAGIQVVRKRGVEQIREHEMGLTQQLIDGLKSLPGVTVHGPGDARLTTPTVSITIEGMHVSRIGQRLDEEFEVLVRVGLHCAPAAHRTIGTAPEGTVRLAPGVFTSEEDIRRTVSAVEKIATG